MGRCLATFCLILHFDYLNLNYDELDLTLSRGEGGGGTELQKLRKIMTLDQFLLNLSTGVMPKMLVKE